MNVFPIKGSNESLVQLCDDGVSHVIAPMLDFLQLLDARRILTRIFQNILQQPCTFGQVAGDLVEQVEELGLPGDQAEHWFGAPWS